jgi:hypothetical protein
VDDRPKEFNLSEKTKNKVETFLAILFLFSRFCGRNKLNEADSVDMRSFEKKTLFVNTGIKKQYNVNLSSIKACQQFQYLLTSFSVLMSF